MQDVPLNPVTTLFAAFSRQARLSRTELFRRTFRLDSGTRILDLGSEDGSFIHSVLEGTGVSASSVHIADLNKEAVCRGAQKYGFIPVVIDESGRLPFPDGFFDIVFCSSVIEHVTVPKNDVWSMHSGRQFRQLALIRQKQFAEEIKRVGRQYFVQTPNRHFPIESHSWLPFVNWFPRRLLIPLLRMTNRFWVKRTGPDWNLLSRGQMSRFFADSTILRESYLGLAKSTIAVRAHRSNGH